MTKHLSFVVQTLKRNKKKSSFRGQSESQLDTGQNTCDWTYWPWSNLASATVFFLPKFARMSQEALLSCLSASLSLSQIALSQFLHARVMLCFVASTNEASGEGYTQVDRVSELRFVTQCADAWGLGTDSIDGIMLADSHIWSTLAQFYDLTFFVRCTLPFYFSRFIL